MWNTKKTLAAFFSAIALTFANTGTSIPAFAEEIENTSTVTEPSTAIQTMVSTEIADSSFEANVTLDANDMQKLVEEIQNGAAENGTDDSEHDYYADDYYDTDGNATLIKHEKIIYDSEEMQFIAVTTKDGNVFYILINYSAEGDEDNVFFLNKVDDFDLYSLLYAGNESEEDKDPVEQAEKYADAATNGGANSENPDNAEETTVETESSEEVSAKKQTSPMNSNMLILIGVGALAVVGGAVFVLKSGKLGKKKNIRVEDFDEDYDDDYGSVTDEDDES